MKKTLMMLMLFGATVLPHAAVAEDPLLTIGVMSDVHINAHADETSASEANPSIVKLRKTLEYFKSRDVDGVLLAGDISDRGFVHELQLAAQVWFNVFPEGKNNGKDVAMLWHYGDHDAQARIYDKYVNDETTYANEHGLAAPAKLCDQLASAWEAAFGETFSFVQVKDVKGYKFVLAHFNDSTAGYNDGIDAAIAGAGLKKRSTFFFSQHRPYACSRHVRYDDADAGRNQNVLKGYPNCVAFCGHSHYTITDPQTVWQGDFSAVNAGALKNQAPNMGSPYENGIAFSYMTDPMAGSQMPSMLEENLAAAEVMRVYQDCIVIERRDMLRNESLGPDLSFVPGGSEPTPDSAARPVLGAGEIAQEVIDGTNRAGTPTRQVKVTFPVARSTKTTPRAYCYAVRAWTEGRQFIQQKIVYSQAAMYSEKMDNSTAYCLFSTAELGGESAVFTVEPLMPWDVDAAVARPEGTATRLPNEYLELEYLTSTGEEYVDTLVHPSEKTRAELNMRYMAIPTVASSVGVIDKFGDDPHERFHTFVKAGEDIADAYLWNQRMSDMRAGYARGVATEWNLYTIDAKNSRVNTGKGFATITKDGSTGTLHPEKNATFWLFGRNSGTSTLRQYTSVRIASATFCEDDVLISQLVPCIRRSDGAYGFYDISGNSKDAPFYPAKNASGTTSKLVPGPAAGGQVDEPLPEEYEPITCLRSQVVKVNDKWIGPYIDTKYNPNSTKTHLKAKMRVYRDQPWGQSDAPMLFSCASTQNKRFQLQVAPDTTLPGRSCFNLGYGESTIGRVKTVPGYGEHTFDLKPNGDWKIDGDGPSTAIGNYGGDFTGDHSLYIFARHPNDRDAPSDTHYSCAALYSMTLSEIEAGELEVVKRKFVPCRRKSDGVLGLYDVSGGAKQEGLSPFFANADTSGNTAFWSEDAVTLPKDYRQLEYIASTDGGNQYIDTGVVPNQYTCADFRFCQYEFVTGSAVPFGACGNNDTLQFFVAALRHADGSADYWTCRQAAVNKDCDAGRPPVVGLHDFTLNQAAYYLDGIKGNAFAGSTRFTASGNAYVFAVDNNGTASQFSPMRLYSLAIWNDATFVRNFVPCLRKVDKKPGLYDTVNGVFYMNAASGEDFIAGPETYPTKTGIVLILR